MGLAAAIKDNLKTISRKYRPLVQAGLSLATIKLAAILLFLLLTSPTASNALASAALLAGVRPHQNALSKSEHSQ